METTTRFARPPQFDLELVLVVAMFLAAGVSFLVACTGAG